LTKPCPSLIARRQSTITRARPKSNSSLSRYAFRFVTIFSDSHRGRTKSGEGFANSSGAPGWLGSRSCRRSREACLLWRFLYVLARNLFAQIGLLERPRRSNELEILLLRHELAVLAGTRAGRAGRRPIAHCSLRSVASCRERRGRAS